MKRDYISHFVIDSVLFDVWSLNNINFPTNYHRMNLSSNQDLSLPEPCLTLISSGYLPFVLCAQHCLKVNAIPSLGTCCSHCLECPLPCCLPATPIQHSNLRSNIICARFSSHPLPMTFLPVLFSRSVAQPCHYLLTCDSSAKLSPKLLAQGVAHNSCLVTVD